MNIKDESMLNYLMTSEFDDQDLTPEDFKLLLFRFRYEYRLLNGRNVSLEKQIEKNYIDHANKLSALNEQAVKDMMKVNVLDNENYFLKTKLVRRNLSLIERITGKLKEND